MKTKYLWLKRKEFNDLKFELKIDSGDDNHVGCQLIATFFGYRMQLALPQWVCKPHREWVDLRDKSWATGSKGYWQVDKKMYGFYLFDNHFVIQLGRQANSSNDTKQWSMFLPWNERNMIEWSIYDTRGYRCFVIDTDGLKFPDYYDNYAQYRDAMAKVKFNFKDYDNEEITASTFIEERVYKKGTGWFKWIGWFHPEEVYKSLDLAFDKETGDRKGSWKGGTLGHSIRMLPQETHKEAFQRYCLQNKMTYIGEVK
jgi:hypothetical protein